MTLLKHFKTVSNPPRAFPDNGETVYSPVSSFMFFSLKCVVVLDIRHRGVTSSGPPSSDIAFSFIQAASFNFSRNFSS